MDFQLISIIICNVYTSSNITINFFQKIVKHAIPTIANNYTFNYYIKAGEWFDQAVIIGKCSIDSIDCIKS